MKSHFLKVLFLSFAFLVFSVSSFAQSSPLTVEIPFNFHIGNERLVAGKYQVKRISANTFLFQNEDGNANVLASTPLTLEVEKSVVSAQLIFNRYENKYFLRQVFVAPNTVGRALYESKTEKQTRDGFSDKEETAKKNRVERIAVKMKSK